MAQFIGRQCSAECGARFARDWRFCWAKPLIRFILVVRTASQLEVVRRRRATIRKRHHVVILEKASFGERPRVPAKAHLPSSRCQTVRFTAAGMWREPAFA